MIPFAAPRTLSVIVPVYNESGTVRQVLDALLEREPGDVVLHRLTTTRQRCRRIWSTSPPIMNGIRIM